MSAQELNFLKQVSSGEKNINISNDIIVPDVKPDIVKIVSSTANTYIYKEDIQEGRFKIEGNMDAYIVYISDSGENKCIQTTLDFSEVVNVPGIDEKCMLDTDILLKSIETTILNERKISIKAELTFLYEINTFDKINNKINISELGNVQTLEEKENVEIFVGKNNNKSSVKEEIKLSDNENAVEILNADFTVENEEYKISYNKVLAKAELNVKIIYINENNKIICSENKFPIMTFIDIANIKETNICKIKYCLRNMLVKINSKETHSISIQSDFDIKCIVMQNTEMNFIKDMYSLDKNMSLKTNNIIINSNCEKENIKISEKINIDNIENVYMIKAAPRIITENFSNEIYNYEGEVILNIFYGENNSINYKNIAIPFLKKSKYKVDFKNLKCANLKYTIDSGYLNLEGEITIQNLSYKNITYVEEAIETEATERSEYNLFMYFAKKEDTIWNISKRFHITKESFMTVNNLTEDSVINCGDKLYIMK